MVRVHLCPPLTFSKRSLRSDLNDQTKIWSLKSVLRNREETWKLNKAKVMQMRILRVICDNEKLSGNKLQVFWINNKFKENSGKQEANGKAKKSAGRMPWHWEPKKDAINCDKPRGAVSTLWSVDLRMEQSNWADLSYHILNKIGIWGKPPELKHLSRARKRNQPRLPK